MLLISDPTARYILLQVHCGDTADQVRQTQSPVDQRMLIRTTRTDTGVLCPDRPQLTTYAKHKNSKRVHVMLALTWIISAVISSPGSHLDHLRRNLVANSSRHELHGAASPDAHPLYVLQLGLPHLLVDGVVLHPVCRDGPALLANISHDSPAHAQVGRRRRSVVRSVDIFRRACAETAEVRQTGSADGANVGAPAERVKQ